MWWLDEHGRAGPVLRALTLDEAMRVLGQSGALSAVLQLPEGAGLWKFKPTVGPRAVIDVEVAGAMNGWLTGLDRPDVALRLLPSVADVSWRLEQAVDAISGGFEHFLNRTVGVVVNQANEVLIEQGGVDALPGNLTSMIRLRRRHENRPQPR